MPYVKRVETSSEVGDMNGQDTPQTAMPATPAAITLTADQLKALIAGAVQSVSGSGTLSAAEIAKAFAATQKRENTQAPMVSAFNPKGDTAHPKPPLRAKTTQNGVELDHDTLTWEEVEALNALPAGEFRVTKANGQKIKMTVNLVRGFDGEKIERVEIHYPCKDEHKTDHRPLVDYCLECIGQAGLESEQDRLVSLRALMDKMRKG